MEETKKLLVIGNGFDLTIGARSNEHMPHGSEDVYRR